MSGGSYDYFFCKVEDFASNIAPTSYLRKAFIKHLLLVAKAAHDIEWVDSCDMCKGDDEKAIRAVLGESADNAVLSIVLKEAKEILHQLEDTINRLETPKEY